MLIISISFIKTMKRKVTIMKKRNAFLTMLSLFMASTFLLTGCGGKAATSPAKKESKIVIAQGSDPLFLNPHGNDEGPTNCVNSNIYDALVFRKGDLSIEPALAESWEQKDEKTWIFHLRKGVKFHNGDPFTADDVVFSFQHCADSKVCAGMVQFVDTIKKIDDNTIELKTKTPFAPLFKFLSKVMIIDKKYVEAVGEEEMNLKPIGTGPYKVVEWVKEDHITMKANESYWKGTPDIQNVIFRPISNEATRTAALLSGDVQLITNVPVHDADQIKQNSRLDFIGKPGLRLIYLTVDVNRDKTPTIEGKNPFTDPKVKEAVQMAIDKDAIVKNIMNGHAYVAQQGNVKETVGYVDGLTTPKYNPEKAKQLLAEAGYPNGFAVTLDAPNNRYPNDYKVAEAVASQLAKVGIQVKLNLMPKSLFFNYIRPGDKTSFNLTGWASSLGDCGDWYNTMFYTRDKKKGHGGSNRGHYTNPAFDAALDNADSTSDMATRTKYLQECTKILAKDTPFIPLYFQEDAYGVSKDLDFKPRLDAYIYVYDIHFKK